MTDLQSIAYRLAELLHDEKATSLVDASEETKAYATRAYLDAIDWDVDIVINGRELREGKTYQDLIEQELAETAALALQPMLEVEMRRLADDLSLSRRVDEEIERRKERAA